MMNRVRAAFALAACLIISARMPAQEASWRIDPNHSAAYFSVRHLMISTVRGSFSGINGALYYDPKDPASIARAIVEAAGPDQDRLRDLGLRRAAQYQARTRPGVPAQRTSLPCCGPSQDSWQSLATAAPLRSTR